MMNLKKIFDCFDKNSNRRLASRRGFGIVEVMISIAVLGFMYAALNKLQLGNHETFLRIRGRDGAVDVAQQVLDSLKSVGLSAIPSNEEHPTEPYTYNLNPVERKWERGLGGFSTISYRPVVTVSPTDAKYSATSTSNLESISHVIAKQVNIKVEWDFKGSVQSVNVSGVIQ